jgi:cobalt-zinc-cadmium efflux system membrane fusion protein
MMKYCIPYISLFILLLSACGGKDKHDKIEKSTAPTVSNGGTTISFLDEKSISFFETEKLNSSNVTADFTAPGKIAATVVASDEGASQNIVLFENPELAGSYTQLIQHQININQIQNINIKQKQIELDRVKDLQLHGAATGKDVLDAQMAMSMEQTNLANEKAALIEHEAKLKAGGFSPDILKKSKAGMAYLICDIPENEIEKIKQGKNCDITFTAFPSEKFTGKIDQVADVVDNMTRMIKLRITVNNSSSKLKSGMFANVSFGVSEGDYISVNKNSLVTVQGKSYVFVKKTPTVFERREVRTGEQIGDRIIIYDGLKNSDEVALQGAMQLKGLSFGY